MQRNGYITLISVLFAGAIAITVALMLLNTTIGGAKSVITREQAIAVRAYASACAEEALERIHEDTAYQGSSMFTFSQGSCQYTVTKLAGQNRTIQSVGTLGTLTRKVYVIANQVLPAITITSWQEVADFP